MLYSSFTVLFLYSIIYEQTFVGNMMHKLIGYDSYIKIFSENGSNVEMA